MPVVKSPPTGTGGQERLGLHPWVGKIPWRRARQPTAVFCLENPMDREDRQTTVGYSPWGCKESNMTVESNIIGRTDAEAEAPIVWPSDEKK